MFVHLRFCSGQRPGIAKQKRLLPVSLQFSPQRTNEMRGTHVFTSVSQFRSSSVLLWSDYHIEKNAFFNCGLTLRPRSYSFNPTMHKRNPRFDGELVKDTDERFGFATLHRSKIVERGIMIAAARHLSETPTHLNKGKPCKSWHIYEVHLSSHIPKLVSIWSSNYHLRPYHLTILRVKWSQGGTRKGYPAGNTLNIRRHEGAMMALEMLMAINVLKLFAGESGRLAFEGDSFHLGRTESGERACQSCNLGGGMWRGSEITNLSVDNWSEPTIYDLHTGGRLELLFYFSHRRQQK